MGITYSFADNTVYGTEDINNITRSLVGAGVAPFVSKSSYNVSDLNALTAALVGSGVQLEGCKCGIQNKGEQNMTVTVDRGIVFFENGVRLEVDDDGYAVAATPNVSGFIYAFYNQALQTADILFAHSLPETGECVCLAEVSAEGELFDKREFAQSKIATLGKNLQNEIRLSRVEFKAYKDSDIISGHKRYAVGVVDADISKFNYALAYHISGKHKCVFDLKNNSFFVAISNYESSSTIRGMFTDGKKWYGGSGSRQYYGFEVVDGMLTFFADIEEGEEHFIYFPDSMTVTLV